MPPTPSKPSKRGRSPDGRRPKSKKQRLQSSPQTSISRTCPSTSTVNPKPTTTASSSSTVPVPVPIPVLPPRLQSLRKRSNPSPETPTFPIALSRLESGRTLSSPRSDPLPTSPLVPPGELRRSGAPSPPETRPPPPQPPRRTRGGKKRAKQRVRTEGPPRTPPRQIYTDQQVLDGAARAGEARARRVDPGSPGVLYAQPGGGGGGFVIYATTTAAAGRVPEDPFGPAPPAMHAVGGGGERGGGRGGGRVLDNSPLASTPMHQRGRGGFGGRRRDQRPPEGISAQFRPPRMVRRGRARGNRRGGGRGRMPALDEDSDSDEGLQIWDEYPASPERPPLPQPGLGDIPEGSEEEDAPAEPVPATKPPSSHSSRSRSSSEWSSRSVTDWRRIPVPWPPIPGTVYCPDHFHADVARWWRVKNLAWNVVQVLAAHTNPTQPASGLQGIAGQALEQMDETPNKTLPILQRFRFLKARLAMGKKAWIELWANKIRDGSAEKAAAKRREYEEAKATWLERWHPKMQAGIEDDAVSKARDELLLKEAEDPEGTTGKELDEMMWNLPFNGWGGYWMHPEGWWDSGAPDLTDAGGEDIGWGDGRPRGATAEKLTKKQREARAERLTAKGLLDLPGDVEGALVMNMVVDWWAHQRYVESGKQSEVPSQVRDAIAELVDEVGVFRGRPGQLGWLMDKMYELVRSVEEEAVVVELPSGAGDGEELWAFDHALGKAGWLLGPGSKAGFWIGGGQPSSLLSSVAAWRWRLQNLRRTRGGNNTGEPRANLPNRFFAKWELQMDISDVEDKIDQEIQPVPNPVIATKAKAGKKTYNETRLGLNKSAESVAARKSKDALPCWYHWREQNRKDWPVILKQEGFHKHRPPVPWKIGSIYGRPWILPLLQNFKAYVLPMVFEKHLDKEFLKLVEEERGLVVRHPIPGLKFFVDRSEGKTRVVLVEMRSIFDDMANEDWGNCT